LTRLRFRLRLFRQLADSATHSPFSFLILLFSSENIYWFWPDGTYHGKIFIALCVLMKILPWTFHSISPAGRGSGKSILLANDQIISLAKDSYFHLL
jgi:hypothetical protein